MTCRLSRPALGLFRRRGELSAGQDVRNRKPGQDHEDAGRRFFYQIIKKGGKSRKSVI